MEAAISSEVATAALAAYSFREHMRTKVSKVTYVRRTDFALLLQTLTEDGLEAFNILLDDSCKFLGLQSEPPSNMASKSGYEP